MNEFPTGPARNEEELNELLVIVSDPVFKKVSGLLSRYRAEAEHELRNPHQSGTTDAALYNYGYNNGCLDQIDRILDLERLLKIQVDNLNANE